MKTGGDLGTATGRLLPAFLTRLHYINPSGSDTIVSIRQSLDLLSKVHQFQNTCG
jgi:hypothetical protein